MIESEERHYKDCKLDPDECERCFWITEAKHAVCQNIDDTHKITLNKEKEKPIKLIYNYKTREWSEE